LPEDESFWELTLGSSRLGDVNVVYTLKNDQDLSESAGGYASLSVLVSLTGGRRYVLVVSVEVYEYEREVINGTVDVVARVEPYINEDECLDPPNCYYYADEL
jgi:hypothetical protein